jgi:hypothetical protein
MSVSVILGGAFSSHLTSTTEVTQSGPLDSVRIGPAIWSEGWDFEACLISLTSGNGAGLDIEFNHMSNDSVNYVYVMKPER